MSKSFGLTQSHIENIRSIVTEQKQSQAQTIRVHIFDSRARETHQPYSDVDLWIEANPPLTQAQLRKLKVAFEESTLPFKFDIETPETVFKPFQPQIETEKRLLLDWF